MAQEAGWRARRREILKRGIRSWFSSLLEVISGKRSGLPAVTQLA